MIDHLLDEEKSSISCCSTDPAGRQIVYGDTSVHTIDCWRRKSYQICRMRASVQSPLLTADPEPEITN